MNVIITGGSRGIGAEAVRRYSALGHPVAFLYEKDEAAARAVARETGARAIRCDVAGEAAAAAVSSAFEDPDLLITCAGVSLSGLIQDTTEAQWDRLFDVNVKGVFHAVKGVVPAMVRRQRGCILTVSSIWGQCGASMEAAYSAAKGAVIALTKALALELGPSHIRVNSIAPGAVRTDMLRSYSEADLETFRQETPLEMLGAPSHIVDAMVYLASAEFVTGQVLAVNGGYYL